MKFLVLLQQQAPNPLGLLPIPIIITFIVVLIVRHSKKKRNKERMKDSLLNEQLKQSKANDKSDKIEEIKRLKSLLDQSVITLDEFNLLKKKVFESAIDQSEIVPRIGIDNTFKNNNEENNASIGVPLWVGWIINVIAWVSFLVFWNHPFELMMGVACCISFLIAYQQRSSFLMYVSGFDAVWMFLWGLGLFGNYA